MTATDVEAIREQMEEAAARRLQPHFIRSFFMEAFRLLGGTSRSASRAATRSRTSRRTSAHGTARSAPVLRC